MNTHISTLSWLSTRAQKHLSSGCIVFLKVVLGQLDVYMLKNMNRTLPYKSILKSQT